MFLYGCNFWHIDMFSILINAKCSNESQPIFLRCLSCCGVVSVIEYHYKSVNKLSSDPDPECSTKTKLAQYYLSTDLLCYHPFYFAELCHDVDVIVHAPSRHPRIASRVLDTWRTRVKVTFVTELLKQSDLLYHWFELVESCCKAILF